MPDLPADVLILIFLAFGVGSFVKGVTGFGMPLITTPVIAPYIGLDHALAVMVVPAIASNLWIMLAQRGHSLGAKTVAPVMVASLPTIGLGVWVLTLTPQRYLLAFMGCWLLAYLVWHFWRGGKGISLKSQKVLGPAVGFLAGFTQGTTGMTTPFVVTYLRALRLPPRSYAYANVVIYQVFWVAHGAFLYAFGLFDSTRLFEGVLAVIPMAIFLPLGIHFNGRVDAKLFDRIIVALMVILSARLFWVAF
jgi:uncharacterized protein